MLLVLAILSNSPTFAAISIWQNLPHASKINDKPGLILEAKANVAWQFYVLFLGCRSS
jgi:hypothetical protein